MYLEVDEIAPLRDPRIQEQPIVRFPDLVAVRQCRVHPARYIRQALGREAPVIPKSPVHRDSVAILEVFESPCRDSSPSALLRVELRNATIRVQELSATTATLISTEHATCQPTALDGYSHLLWTRLHRKGGLDRVVHCDLPSYAAIIDALQFSDAH